MGQAQFLIDGVGSDNGAKEVFLLAIAQAGEIDGAIFALDGRREACGR
jgi:hypothetical protein